MAEVTPHDFLAQQGATFVVFHPCGEQLVLGLGCSEQPAVVPHCVAYRKTVVDQHRSASPTAVWPHQQAYEALLQVQRTLHLPAPPKPSSLQQPQQTPQDTNANSQTDAFPAAKAGLISQKQVTEGSDGFIWLDDQQQQKLLQRQQPTQQQHQQQQKQQHHQHGQQQQQPGMQLNQPQLKLPCFAGGQVPALWPPETYEAHWLMTPDNHIAGLDSLPQHVLLDRFEATWGWALHQLGLPRARWRHLSAVLAVPMDMTAAEVRLFADLLLGRLSFGALVVHLEPVAACFGNGTTSACVVNVGSSSCTVCCVDDAVVLPPVSSRFTLPFGLVDVAGALTGWMACYGHWPDQLQQRGIGFSGRAGCSSSSSDSREQGAIGLVGAAAAGSGATNGGVSPDSVYSMLLLEDLVLQQCYFPKENYQPGLLGQPMLEDQQAAVVPVRIPGQPTTNYSVSLGSWAAAAAMTLFFPDIAPVGLSRAHQDHDQYSSSSQGNINIPQIKHEKSAQAAGVGAQAAAAVPAAAIGDSHAVWMHRLYHAGVHEIPAAEALYMQSQLKVRLEAGETGPPPDGMYLLPSDFSDKPVGAAAAAGGTEAGGDTVGGAEPANSAGGSRQSPQVSEGKAAVAGGAVAGAGVGATAERRSSAGGSKGAAAATAPSMGLDEAVFHSIMAVSSGRAELMSRLAAGLLLLGPGGGLRGLGPMLERRVGVRFNAARQPQIVSSLEPRAEPAHVAWKGAALLAALDSGRENWLPRHQWVDGGMVIPAPSTPAVNAATAAAGGKGTAAAKKAAAAAAAGGGAAGGAGSGGPAGAGAGSNSTAAAGVVIRVDPDDQAPRPVNI